MISREDIKEGLKFRMPSNTLKWKRQVEGFGNIPEFREPTQHLTTLKTPGGDKRYVTPEVPFFEVCGGPKLISSADKNDPYCAWVGEYIMVRSDALGKKPLYISLGDVMQHGRRAIDANLCHIFSTENPKNDWAYNFICGGSRSGGKKYRMEHYGCSLDPIDVLSKLSAFTEQPTGDADAFRDITNGMYARVEFFNKDSTEVRIDADVKLGLIDSGYTGEVKAIVKAHEIDWLGVKRVFIPAGTKIAQMRIVEIPNTELVSGVIKKEENDDKESNDKKRGDNGFNSTGVK